jgi:hypothetical protein
MELQLHSSIFFHGAHRDNLLYFRLAAQMWYLQLLFSVSVPLFIIIITVKWSGDANGANRNALCFPVEKEFTFLCVRMCPSNLSS